MPKRPLAVTFLGWLFVAAGAGAVAMSVKQFEAQGAPHHELVWILLLNSAAIVCGIFLLRGSSWARWLALAWMAGHVVLSLFHSLQEAAVHLLLFFLIAYLLFREDAKVYFRATAPKSSA
ncbi:MAG TPA: hypothetical protein VGR96_08215 [Acidobacteriaceae bacterium]|nr:hypothetical protein [Acidobacteriaceae bacterium]